MLYTITERQVINDYQPEPGDGDDAIVLVPEYHVVGDDGTVFLRTKSEDKARARHNQMTILADIREL